MLLLVLSDDEDQVLESLTISNSIPQSIMQLAQILRTCGAFEQYNHSKIDTVGGYERGRVGASVARIPTGRVLTTSSDQDGTAPIKMTSCLK